MTKTLVYIIGAGRSGTTLLDIVLGNAKNAISLGEINRFFRRSGVPPKRKDYSKVYKYWKKIRNDFLSDSDLDIKQLEKEFENNEYHTSWLKCLFKLNSKSYQFLLQKHYQSILRNTHESIIIESSKYPSRAINICNYVANENLEVKFIYLRKDPVSVVKSFEKKGLEQPSKGFLASNLYYLLVNIICQFSVFSIRRKGFVVSKVKYEDLIEKRDLEIRRVGEDLSLNLLELEDKLKKNSPLDTGFLFDGNRIRLKETLHLRTSEANDSIKTGKEIFTRIFNYIVYR
ncbi:hypothetical protein [uncultured Winogradskyella sp.]|uniref:hypothetical protein n=1 Tax=uncultured Winogradskyella sp. TaxID=395353 RepID=UPI0035166A3C